MSRNMVPIFHRAEFRTRRVGVRRDRPTFGGLVEEVEHIPCGRCVQLPQLAACRPQRLVAEGQIIHERDELPQALLDYDPWFRRAIFPIECRHCSTASRSLASAMQAEALRASLLFKRARV